jgi:Ca2+/H+ antiporter
MLQIYVLYKMIFKTDRTSKETAIAYLFYTSKLRISIIQVYVLVLMTRTGQHTSHFLFAGAIDRGDENSTSCHPKLEGSYTSKMKPLLIT